MCLYFRTYSGHTHTHTHINYSFGFKATRRETTNTKTRHRLEIIKAVPLQFGVTSQCKPELNPSLRFILKEEEVRSDSHPHSAGVQIRRLPVQCGGFGALGCAGPASREASPGQESCGWEEAAQRTRRSGPPGPASDQRQHINSVT